MYVVFENNLVVSVFELEEDLELTCSNIYLIYGLHCESTKAKVQLRDFQKLSKEPNVTINLSVL